MKLLILIVCSDDKLVYQMQQGMWRSYMHLFPGQADAYFLRSVSSLPVSCRPCRLNKDTFDCHTTDTLIPGIGDKTVIALEQILGESHYPYVLRTNLSSVWNIPQLFKHLQIAPREQYYAGVPLNYGGIDYASGAGILMSYDVAARLAYGKVELIGQPQWDDVLFGQFFATHGIHLTALSRVDISTLDEWSHLQKEFPEDAFHFRLRHALESLRATDEVQIGCELISRLYGPLLNLNNISGVEGVERIEGEGP